ncbi:MAG: hypothetical protein MUF15_09395 [Acidobacteria bacterium]|jgi:nucleoside-triphosphatase THEP1|nr:hypothetical protein [Acidobacteriota bacterium]
MITIIAGEINSGKTRAMISIYRRQFQNKGDGFVSQKIFADKNNFTGYEIVRLSTQEKKPLAYRAPFIPMGWDEIYCCGPFRFSKAAFIFAGNIIQDIIQRDITPVFIDEIGPLELAGKGFASILQEVLLTPKDVYITVRNHCLEAVLNKFAVREHNLIRTADTADTADYADNIDDSDKKDDADNNNDTDDAYNMNNVDAQLMPIKKRGIYYG